MGQFLFLAATAMKASQGTVGTPRGKILKTAATACALAILPALPAPAEAATVTLVPAAGPAGTSTTAHGRGFAAGARVLVRVGGARPQVARAGGRGRFRATVTIPKGARGSVRVVSSRRKRRAVNVFRVHAGREPGTGDVAAEDGAGVRWSPLEGAPRSTLTIAIRGFPPKRRLTVRFGSTGVAAGRIDRRGRTVRRLDVPNRPAGRLPVRAEAGRRTLRFDFVLTTVAPPARAGGGPGAAAARLLLPAIENVTSATAYRYHTRDDKGSTMDTLKVIPSPGGGYLGVYHTLTAGVFVTKLARSTNLLTWTHVVDLEPNASQPTIAPLSDGGFLVGYEKDAGCTGTGPPGANCLGFRHYPNLASLLAGTGDRSRQLPRSLSNCAEGTPNIYGAELSPDIDHSTIDVGFHYFRNCDVDRQARGTLRNFSSWTASPDSGLNAVFEAFRPAGNIGDRDFMRLGGASFNFHEVQFTKGDFGSWRVYLYDWLLGLPTPLAIRTHRGSTAFANPTFTHLTSPAGRPAVLVTLFIPQQGAAPAETGELVYYHEL
jgi:hypothetical protein